MRVFCFVFLLWAFADSEEKKAFSAAGSDDPSYKVLFESGFYKDAIEVLNARLSGPPDSTFTEYRKYLAFCYILTDNRAQAEAEFTLLLQQDPGFNLDPIRTSPKIYEVFAAARKAWNRTHQPAPDTVQPAAQDTLPVQQVGPAPDLFDPWYQLPVYCSPLAAGQFYNRHRTKGIILAAVQAVGLGASIYAYNKKDPDLGWTKDNQNYNLMFRIQFGLFAGAYLYSIVDGLRLRDRRTDP